MRKVETRRRLAAAMICLFLVLSALWVYHPIRHHGATNCDDFYITDNRFLPQSAWNLKTLVYVMTTVTAGVWMPISYLLIGHEYFAFGTDYGLYHLVCLLLHMANAILLFFTLRLMTGAFWKSALAAALFTLHPLNVEPVAWLVGVRVVLCGFFSLAAIFFYVLHIRRAATWPYVLALFAFALSITSVPMYVTLPFVLLLIDYWPLGRITLLEKRQGTGQAVFNWTAAGRLIWEKMPFFVLILGMSVIVLASHDLPFVHHYSLPHRLLNIPIAYVQYLSRFFYPAGLSVFYPFPTEFPAWKVAGAVLLLLAITAVALRTAGAGGAFITGWLWFAGMMVPLSGIVQIGTQAMADHYMYLPMIGLLMMIVWGADAAMGNWKAKPVVAAVIAAVVLALFTRLSARQIRVWENSFTLSSHALAVTKNNYEAHNYLGHAFAEKGNREKAVYHFTRALALRPDHAKSHYNLATVYMQAGNLEKAQVHYESAFRADPANATTSNSLGLVLAAQGRLPEAISHYQEALKTAPEYFQARNNLATALAAAGRLEESAGHYRKALALAPDSPTVLFNLADVLAGLGKNTEAAQYLEKALVLHPDMAKARLRLADIRMAMGDPEAAAAHYEFLAARIPGSADLHYRAGRALHQSGHTARAVYHLKQALTANPSLEAARELLRQMETRPAPQAN